MEKESQVTVEMRKETPAKDVCKFLFLSVDKKTVENYVAATTAHAMSVKERLRQKKEKAIGSVPVLRTVYRKIQNFDKRMTEKHGQTYVKIRDGFNCVARAVVAAQLFGGWGIVGACACEMYETAAAFLEPAEKARQEGKVKGIFDYLKKNKEEAAVSTTNSVLKVVSVAGKIMGAVGLRKVALAGKAALFVGSKAVEKVRKIRKKKAEKKAAQGNTAKAAGKTACILKMKNAKDGR